MIELGQKVTVTKVVGRSFDGYKTVPTSEIISPITGIVIGKSRVYEINNGSNPPMLTNPKPVYVVALSLTKRVKVFPEDLEEEVSRQTIDDPTLVVWVDEVLREKVDNGESFTAYAITKEVRAKHPGFDISNDRVRPIVHNSMAESIQLAGLEYTAADQDFNGQQAIEYKPE